MITGFPEFETLNNPYNFQYHEGDCYPQIGISDGGFKAEELMSQYITLMITNLKSSWNNTH